MSYTLVDKFGVTVGRYCGPDGAQMVQFTLADDGCIVCMTLEQFNEWHLDLARAVFDAALAAHDPPGPRTLAAMGYQPRPHVMNGPDCSCPNDDYHQRVYGAAAETGS
jgi:hypothetical protein